jgi:Xaa-Pro aminopeptidase
MTPRKAPPRHRKDPHANRRQRLGRKLAAQDVHAVLVTSPVDVGYLTPFTGSGQLLLGRGWSTLITDAIHDEQARSECKGMDIRVGTLAGELKGLLRDHQARRVGISAEDTRLAAFLHLQDILDPRRIVMVADLIGQMRLIKDDVELRAIRKAVRVSERAFCELTAQGKRAFVGRSERQIAAELDYRMRTGGAEAEAFDTVVAAGAAASRPHHRPRARKVRPGETVLIDWGAKVDGYCSDLTRVLLTGRISPALREVYELVRRAQAVGIRAVGPAVAAATPDAAAREIIAGGGHAERFVHTLGHGLGREVHEGPPLAGRNVSRLRPGMVVTVEPGIYLPGRGGVRIEDDVLVTATGRRRLSTLPTDLERMTLR